MTENKTKISMGQKLLIMVWCVLVSVVIVGMSLLLLSLVLFLILDKLMPGNGTVSTLGMVVPLIWAPILGIIFGIIIGIIVAISKIKKYENK